MELKDLKEEHLTVIRKFVNSEAFLEIKDAFVSHTPEKGPEGKDGDCDSKNLGKLLGTRYVFNHLQALARKPNQPNTGKEKQRGRADAGMDPDLET